MDFHLFGSQHLISIICVAKPVLVWKELQWERGIGIGTRRMFVSYNL